MHVAVYGLPFDEIAYKKIVFAVEICIDLYIGCVISIALYRSAKYAGGLEPFFRRRRELLFRIFAKSPAQENCNKSTHQAHN